MTLSIPNHGPCKGVTSSVWDKSQCRICWLAAYDQGYRRHWKVQGDAKVPELAPEQLYPCIHRGSNPLKIPGCSTCGSGKPLGRACGHHHSGASQCLVAGTDRQEQTARSYGFLVCKDCGWREPEPNLEMPLGEFRTKLDMPVGTLPDGWWNWRVAYLGVKDALRELASQTHLPQKKLSGRGIVIAAGGPTYFRMAFAVRHILRRLGCNLPVQFWYLPGEVDQFMLELCKEFSIETVDASGLGIKTRMLGGWELKPFAVQHSTFSEVLSLDADCLPTQDPTHLFDEPEYHQNGSIFWADIKHPATSPCRVPCEVWGRAGLPPQTDNDFESGQFLINKVRCWKELVITNWINNHSDYWYKFIYGDKDTFRIAWRLCGKNYSMPPGTEWSSPCILQKNFDGSPQFVHACRGKSRIISGVGLSGYPHNQWIREAKDLLDARLRVLTRYGSGTTILQNNTTTVVESPCCSEGCDERPEEVISELPTPSGGS